MASVIFLCPNLGVNVQGWLADNGSETKGETYESVKCNACQMLHFVNRRTGHVLGTDGDK